jgi:hypothetical protein
MVRSMMRRSAAVVPLGALAAVSTRSLLILVLAGFVVLLALVMVGVVVTPAIWSRKKQRRDSALAVLDRIFRWDIRSLGEAEETNRLRAKR